MGTGCVPASGGMELLHDGAWAVCVAMAVANRWLNEKGLVLQSRIVVWGSCSVVAASGGGLMASSPCGPSQRSLGAVQSRPDNSPQQPPYFGLCQKDHVVRIRQLDQIRRWLLDVERFFFCECAWLAAVRITLSSASAAIDKVT